MTIIIKKGAFDANLNAIEFSPLDEWLTDPSNDVGVDVSPDADPQELIAQMNRISAVRILFPTSADGRGNSIAKALRQAGFQGLLRAYGHIHSDQYPLALRCGFDEVEIEQELAERQPEELWRETLPRLEDTYLGRFTKPGSTPQLQA